LCEFHLVPGLHPEIFGGDFHCFKQPSDVLRDPSALPAPLPDSMTAALIIHGIGPQK
jgi:hypothetical protein